MINLLVESLLQGDNLEDLLLQSLREEENHITDQKEKVGEFFLLTTEYTSTAIVKFCAFSVHFDLL